MRLQHIGSTLGLALWIARVPAMAQPVASDGCSFGPDNEYAVQATCTSQPFQLPAGYTADLDPASCGSSGHADAFGWFTATADSITIEYAPNNNTDPVLHIFSGTCDALTLVSCVNDLGMTGTEWTTIPTTIGANYLIRLQTAEADDPIPYGSICITETPLPPPNDEPCGAIDLPVNIDCTQPVHATNLSATATAGIVDPGCHFNLNTNGDVWFKTVVPAGGHLIVDTESDQIADAGMALYSSPSCGGSFSLIDCDDDGSDNGMPKLDETGLDASSTVYIRFWAYFNGRGRFSICASSGITVLPVELVAFDAAADDNTVQLTWSTASETNSDRFEVERSIDNSTFSLVGSLASAGSSQQAQHYRFTDDTPWPGTNYYRLRQVDRDGKFAFSPTITGWIGPGAGKALIFPNPATDLVHVAFPGPMEQATYVYIRDAQGRTVPSAGLLLERGTSVVDLAIGGLAPGAYSVRVVSATAVTAAGTFLKN